MRVTSARMLSTNASKRKNRGLVRDPIAFTSRRALLICSSARRNIVIEDVHDTWKTFRKNLVMDITSLFTLRNQNQSIERVVPLAGIFSSSGTERQFDLFTERLSSNITFVRSFARSFVRSFARSFVRSLVPRWRRSKSFVSRLPRSTCPGRRALLIRLCRFNNTVSRLTRLRAVAGRTEHDGEQDVASHGGEN